MLYLVTLSQHKQYNFFNKWTMPLYDIQTAKYSIEHWIKILVVHVNYETLTCDQIKYIYAGPSASLRET